MAATCGCGRTNPDGAKFCVECGGPISRACGSCGIALPPDAKFCPECGLPVGGGSEADARRETRKVVTIVFVDLAGSTSLQEHMDPESVRRVMERFYALMRSEVEAAGGVVVKFTGDGVMAGFGIREAREDDALRAVRAAVSMQESFGAFAHEIRHSQGADVSLRVGVNTGEVVVSDSDDDVVGDVVNVAARLEHAAGDGNVLVGDETWKLTRHDATFEAVAPLELKGKAEPVPAHRVVSLETPTEEEGTAAPLVGRTAELRRLQEVFESCDSPPAPSIITVVGSPGLGKSRLASEFVSSVSNRARVLEARCEAAGTATYAPIAEAFRQAAGIADTAASAEVVASIEALMPDGFDERGRVGKLVASLLGVGDAATPQETFWAVRRLLEALAVTQPVVVVVDDVQWAEPMLLDLLDHVVEWAKDAAILIVALARPEIREVRPSLLDQGAIVLEGLDPADTAALAQSLLGAHELPAALVGRILATTEGNPLFVRELLRMLVDDGVLLLDSGRWVISVEAAEIDVPPTIHALLSARIERLRDDERYVMERASVVGQEFYRGAVIELVPTSVRGGIDVHLETLRRKELVEPEGSYWIDERVFRFHHVLIRDAAYRRLLKEARAELHERFADWLEAKVGDLVGEHEEVLGYHLEQARAYRKELGSLDDHGRDLGRRASAHLASAARRALDRDDLAAAANLSGRALALTEDDALRASILLDRCEALLAMGDVDAAAEAVSELRLRSSDARLRAWADCFDGQLVILTDPARLRQTADLVEGAAHRLAELEDSAGAAKGHAVHAQALGHLGQFGACEAALDRALAAAREAGDRRRANAVLSSAPIAALWGPSRVPRASGRCLDVVRVLRITAGAPAVEATALRCQAVLEAMRGRFDAAHRMLASASARLEELGLRHALVECDMFAGLIDLLSGDTTSAEVALRSAHEGFRALNVGTDTAQAAALLARALVQEGRDDEALVLTAEAERLGGDDLKTAIAWRCVRARALARRGDVDGAVELARAAVALAEPTDALVDHADARLALAEVLSAAGRHEEARAESRRGAELYARKEATGAGSLTVGTEEDEAPVGPSSLLERSSGGVRAAPGVEGDVSRWELLRRALLARDRPGIAALYSRDHEFVDRRGGLRAASRGKAFLDAGQAMWDRVETGWDLDVEVLAQWSEGVSLSRVRRFGDGWETAALVLRVSHSDGTWLRTEQFDEGDYTAAFDRLNELAYETSVTKSVIARYLSGPKEHSWTDVVPVTASGTAALVRADGSLVVLETAEGRVTTVERFDLGDELGARRRLHSLAPGPSYVAWLIRHHFDRHAHQDWGALRGLSAPTVLLVDRRPVGWGIVEGIDQVLEHLQEGARTASMAPGELWITEWLAIAPDRALFRYRWAGTNPDGVDFEIDRLLLMRVRARDGLLVRSYMYNPDQIDDARRFMMGDDVFHRAAPGVDAELSLYDRARAAMLDRDPETMLELHTPDHVFVDHRAGLQSAVSGPTEFLEGSARTYQGLEHSRLIEILSQWTDDVSLSRSTSRGEGFEISSLFVKVTQDGAWCRTEQLDADDFESAFVRLDDLSYQHSAAIHAIERYVSTRNEHAWTEVIPLVGAGNVALVRADSSLAVVTTAAGRVTGVEVFDADDELGSRRRLHELVPSPSHLRWMTKQYIDAHNAQDWDAIRRLQEPTFVVDDRRPLGGGRIGIDGMIEHLQEGMRTTRSLKVEVRDWIALSSSASAYVLGWHGVTNEGAAFDYPRIVVYTCGSSGLGTRGAIFEIDQIDEARRCMAATAIEIGDDSEAARDGDPAGQLIVAAVRNEDDLAGTHARLDALEQGDVPARARLGDGLAEFNRWYCDVFNSGADIEQLYSPDFEIVEHGHHIRMGLGVHLRVMHAQLAQASSRIHIDTIVSLGMRHGVCRTMFSWEMHDGTAGRSEVAFWSASRLDPEGRFLYAETFPLDQLPTALARAEELYIEDEATGEAAAGARRRLTAWRMVDAHNVGDWATVAEGYAPDVVFLDRRVLGWDVYEGRESVIELHRAIAAGSARHVWVVSELHAITDHGYVYTHPAEGVDRDGGHNGQGGVTVVLLTDEGVSCVEVFSSDAIDEALRRFEELHSDAALAPFEQRTRDAVATVTAGAPTNDYTKLHERWVDALRRRDWDSVATLLSPKMVVEDRRAGLQHVVRGRAEVIKSQREAANLDYQPARIEVVATRGERLALHRIAWSLQDDSEVEMLVVGEMDEEGLRCAAIVFDADDLEKAVDDLDSRYDATLPPTTVERGWSRLLAAWNARDIAAVEELLAPEYRCYEHAHHLEMDREAVLADTRRTGTVPGAVRSDRPLALGDRHLLADFTWTGHADDASGESSMTVWHVRRVDADGKFLLVEVFADDAYLEALARVEELYLESEASGIEARASRNRLRLWRALIADNEGDWETWRSLVEPDALIVDRSPMGWGEVDAEGVQERQEMLTALIGEGRITVRSMMFVGDVVMAEVIGKGTNTEGGSFEIARWLIQVGSKYQEHFDLEQREQAERRFRELVETSRAQEHPQGSQREAPRGEGRREAPTRPSD